VKRSRLRAKQIVSKCIHLLDLVNMKRALFSNLAMTVSVHNVTADFLKMAYKFLS
jgi:hypothetical protein